MGQYRAIICDTVLPVLGQYNHVLPKVLARLWKVVRLHPGQHWPNPFSTLDQCWKAIVKK